MVILNTCHIRDKAAEKVFSELGRLRHQEQLHQVAIDRRTARLHEKDIAATDRLLVVAVGLAVGERLQLDGSELDAELVGDVLRQHRVRAPGKEHQPLARAALDPALLRFRIGRHGPFQILHLGVVSRRLAH